MTEAFNFSEKREKILPNQTLLLAEPIFRNPTVDESKKSIFTVPRGAEKWVKQIPLDHLTSENITEVLANEYLAIASCLKKIGVPFRIIIAHRKDMDLRGTLAILQHFGARGLALDESISETCFPRDMMVDFDGQTYINPYANFKFPDNSGIISPLGEGGRVLKLSKKIFVPHPNGYVKTKEQFLKDVRSLSDRFQFGFLPHPLAVETDVKSDIDTFLPNDHLDRVASFIRGEDGKDYLLLDKNYVNEYKAPYDSYWQVIKGACQKLEIVPVVVERKPESIPYALNLEQFTDGTVLLTGGDNNLAELVRQIVGYDRVYTTNMPIIFYPLYRNGGIRCMLLHAPQKIVGQPVAR